MLKKSESRMEPWGTSVTTSFKLLKETFIKLF